MIKKFLIMVGLVLLISLPLKSEAFYYDDPELGSWIYDITLGETKANIKDLFYSADNLFSYRTSNFYCLEYKKGSKRIDFMFNASSDTSRCVNVIIYFKNKNDRQKYFNENLEPEIVDPSNLNNYNLPKNLKTTEYFYTAFFVVVMYEKDCAIRIY